VFLAEYNCKCDKGDITHTDVVELQCGSVLKGKFSSAGMLSVRGT